MSLTLTRLALQRSQPCLVLVWKRREGIAHDCGNMQYLRTQQTGVHWTVHFEVRVWHCAFDLYFQRRPRPSKRVDEG